MAQITGLLEKQRALKDIQGMIKSLEPLNQFLSTPNPSNEYSISFGKTKAPIYCETKETIDNLVKAKKALIVNEIKGLAEAHSITLDDEDLKIMNELYFTGAAKAARNNAQ